MSSDESVRYEMDLTPAEAREGTRKLLTRMGKKLEVKIPAGTRDGYTVKLTNALQVTDGSPGDILITIKVAGQQAGVIEINDNSFTREVIESSEPAVVDFWAPWCGPCKLIAPIVEELAKEYAHKIKIGKINIDEDPKVATHLGIMSIPTLVFFKKGKAVDQIVGALGKAELKRKIEENL